MDAATLETLKVAPGYWYVGSPYSKYPRGIEAAFEDVARFCARLVEKGVAVYSPIAHTHPIATYGGINPYDHSIWLPADRPMMDAAHGMIIAMLPTWRDSYGIAEEIRIFAAAGKPIVRLAPGDL